MTLQTLNDTTTQNFSQTRDRLLLLETLIENTPLGILVLSPPNLKVEVISPMARAKIPIKVELGKPLFEYTKPNPLIENFRLEHDYVLSSGNTIQVTDKLVQDSEKLNDRYFSYSLARLTLNKNRYCVLAVGLETTDRVRLQRELEQRVEARTSEIQRAYTFVNAVLENIPDMIFVKEAKNLRFTRINKAAEELLGYESSELIGKNDYDFFPKSEADFFVSKDRAVFSSRNLVEIPMEPIHTRQKGRRILHTKKVPIFNDKNEPEYLLGISEDITEKIQSEENSKKLFQETLIRNEAERAIKLRDEFISIAAHELKTPLTSLRMQIQLLESSLSEIESSKTPKFVELMRRSKDQLDQFTKLVDDLLDVSRASSGHITLSKTKVNLSNLINQITKRYRSENQNSQCELLLELGTEIIGDWDPVRIDQVVVNLLSNAMKYGLNKPIKIVTWIEGTVAKLKVQDQGIGISKTDQLRIFNRFERAVSSKAYSGLGLGLYITRQIVQAHGGKISVESESGKGSTFVVELPLCQQEKTS